MTDEELIARLRSDHPDHLTSAAADRIEALVKELAVSNEIGRAFEEDAWLQRTRAERLEAALQFYSCKDGCNDCSENERDLIGCGWTARVALQGADHD